MSIQGSPRRRRSKVMDIVRVSSGNFLEMYDFMVAGYYASAIGAAFFPLHNPVASLLAALASFGVGYLMRPLGALVLGAYIDKHGRRVGLILTLSLMAVGTASVAFMPTYASVGIAAPIVILVGRLVQGFSAGVELGGVSVYLSEIAPPGRKGFYVAWQSGSQQVAVVFAAALGVFMHQRLSADEIQSWGWRIPLIIGCLIIPFMFYIRSSLAETEEFKKRGHHATLGEIMRSVAGNWRLVLIGMLMVMMTTVSFYLITAYTPTFGKQLHLSDLDSFLVTLCVGVSNLFWLPIMGALSDRVGRRPLLIGFTVLAILTAYPMMSWLASAPSFERLLMVELWLSFLYGSYNGAMVVYLTEIMPPELRASGFSMAYSLATAVGGFTPAICAWLVAHFSNPGLPGAWMSAAAVCGLVAALLLRRPPRPVAKVSQAASA